MPRPSAFALPAQSYGVSRPQIAFDVVVVERRGSGPSSSRRSARCASPRQASRSRRGRCGSARPAPRSVRSCTTAASCRARLAERAAVAFGDLVGADHDRVGPAAARRPAPSRATGARGRRRALAVGGALVDVGHDDVERHREPFEQRAPIRRAGGEDERRAQGSGRRKRRGAAVKRMTRSAMYRNGVRDRGRIDTPVPQPCPAAPHADAADDRRSVRIRATTRGRRPDETPLAALTRIDTPDRSGEPRVDRARLDARTPRRAAARPRRSTATSC